MIEKSGGKTETEKILAELCNNTFLKTWSFANPYNAKSKGKEFCDLVAVFENHLFIFFDREKSLKFDANQDPGISWNRWYKDVILKQIKTCHGAERYIRTNGTLYLDAECIIPFPIKFEKDTVVIHKIIVANGAKDACKDFSKENVNGSLGITYREPDDHSDFPYPFSIAIDKRNPVHIFDSYNFPILLKELDTFYDFVSFILEKERVIEKYIILSYSGEEDLLAHYIGNFDIAEQKHFIGVKNNDINALLVAEGEWNDFQDSPAYISRQKANEKSYFWDALIQHTLGHALSGKAKGNSDIFNGKSALYEMAKEPRVSRRMLSDILIESINQFPINDSPLGRKLTYMNSYYKNVGYVLIQLKNSLEDIRSDRYRQFRQFMLEIACGAAKNKFPELQKVIGIAMEPPILYEERSEDFILLDCSGWTTEQSDYYRNENSYEGMKFFLLDSLTYSMKHVTEFPDSRRKT